MSIPKTLNISQIVYKLIRMRNCTVGNFDVEIDTTSISKDQIQDTKSSFPSSSITQSNNNINHPSRTPIICNALNFLEESCRKNRIIFFGEIHSIPQIIALQTALQEQMVEVQRSNSRDNKSSGLVNVVLEHFSFEMQDILEQYQSDEISFEELVEAYNSIGTENHNLIPYQPLFEHAKANHDIVRLHAGFIPRTYARNLIKEPEEGVLSQSIEKGWIPGHLTSLDKLDDSGPNSFHYNLFESMITGRSIYDSTNSQPVDRYLKIFKAQLLKDISMAHKVNQLLLSSDNEEDRIIVIAGYGHLMHFQGVPNFVFKENPSMQSQSCLIVSHASDDDELSINEHDVQNMLQDYFGDTTQHYPPAADFLYLFDTKQQSDVPDIQFADHVKEETRKAYEKVGQTAHLEGNVKKANAIMTYLGYTPEEISFLGEDEIYNFQGVGNPHLLAKIQQGEKVLDIGSGLGIDSFLASYYTGKDGEVVGIDMSKKEVAHTQRRAEARNINHAQFISADMDQIPLPDNSFDVIISNGAFCLAPDKEKSLLEMYRLLRPGGRMSICTSVAKNMLPSGIAWPICMRAFIQENEIKSLCDKIGFTDLYIDDTDSLMEFELEGITVEDEQEDGNNSGRSNIHVGGKEFEHLQEYDMNKMCARVCIFAKKPL